jgi:hypothetical protein
MAGEPRRRASKLLRLASRARASPWDSFQGSEGRLISLSEGVVVKPLSDGAPSVPLLPQSVPLLAEFIAVLLDLSEHHLEARQLGFDRRQLSL